MQRKLFIIIISILALGTILISCSEREENLPTPIAFDDSTSQVITFEHEFLNELSFIMFAEYRADPKIYGKIYTPPGYQGPNLGTPYPVLYLLSPYSETEDFYFNHGLQDVADRLISEGKIQPMIIVCINGSNSYGGSFYGNSWAGGFMTDIIGSIQDSVATGSLLDYVDAAFNTVSDLRHGAGAGRKARAISGVGIGGYGAMRVAITYDENFSAVSAISAPLDFDGASGNGGFIPLFKDVVDKLDTTVVGADSAYKLMDTSYTYPLRTMFFAAATNFSPHDTLYIDPTFHPRGPANNAAYWDAVDTLMINDDASFFYPEGFNTPMRFHLPFDSHGDPHNPIWQMWLRENPENLLANNPGALDNTAILLMTSADGADASLDFDQQTLDFETYLQSQGIAFNDSSFSGYTGYPATGNRFLYDIIGDILQFHSAHFELPEF